METIKGVVIGMAAFLIAFRFLSFAVGDARRGGGALIVVLESILLLAALCFVAAWLIAVAGSYY